jgi:hypothetical protein
MCTDNWTRPWQKNCSASPLLAASVGKWSGAHRQGTHMQETVGSIKCHTLTSSTRLTLFMPVTLQRAVRASVTAHCIYITNNLLLMLYKELNLPLHIPQRYIQEVHSFLTSALARGNWSASYPSCLTPGATIAGYPLNTWLRAPEPVWMLWEKKNFLPLPGITPWFVEPTVWSLNWMSYTGSCG